ncbi:MAG: S41 family peptidase [Filifactoraceae bacterium]
MKSKIIVLIIIVTGSIVFSWQFGKNQYTDFQKDFLYIYDAIDKYYAYPDKEELQSFMSHKEEYLKTIQQCKTEEEFVYETNNILRNLGSPHTLLMSQKDSRSLYQSCKEALKDPQLEKEPKIKEYFQYLENIFESKNVQEKYKNLQAYQNKNEKKLSEESNAKAFDIIPNKVAYISIAKMIRPEGEEFSRDESIILPYLKKVKDYSALIIDIRGNGGGDTDYWMNFLLPYIIQKDQTLSSSYVVVKTLEGDKQIGLRWSYEKIDKSFQTKLVEGLSAKEKNRIEKILTDYQYVGSLPIKVKKEKDSISFSGKIYLLVDGEVGSAAVCLGHFAKQLQLATIIGSTTMREGMGNGPIFLMTPNKKLVFQTIYQLPLFAGKSLREAQVVIPDIYVANKGSYDNDNKVKETNGIVNYQKDQMILQILKMEHNNNN